MIASCPTVVLASLDTFHTKCKPLILYAVILVKNSNIVTVFSTYINIICTRQQTGVSLSLAILARSPQPPFISLFLFSFSLFPHLRPPCPHPLRKVRGHSLHLRCKSLWFQNWVLWTLPAGASESQKPDLLERALNRGSGGLGFQQLFCKLPRDLEQVPWPP